MNKTPQELIAIQAQSLGRTFRRRHRGSGMKAALKSFLHSEYVEKIAVSDVSFTIKKGTCVGLVGANGAGKTTLLKMCAGLLHPTSGDIHSLGFKPTDRRAEFQKKIGMVMGQKSQLWIDIPALETYELLAAIYEVPDAVFRARLKELTKVFQVENFLNVQVRRLSLGERMKLEIIAALLHNPEILILDEPTIGLDVLARRNIRQFIREYNRIHKTTVILSSHDMTDIQEVCSELMLIADGKLVFNGRLRDFESLHSKSPHLRLRDVAFLFDLGQELPLSVVESIAGQSNAQILEAEAASIKFRIDMSQVSKLVQFITAHATPSDIRVEGQSLEAIVHDLMTQKGNGA